MLIGYVSDEFYAALADAAVEFRSDSGVHVLARSWPSGAVCADVPAGEYEVCLAKPGFGSKRVRTVIGNGPVHFRLLSDRLLGYAWPKWCRAGDRVEFRVHSVEPYKLGLWRYGLRKQRVQHIGWFDNHGPRAVMQTLPDDGPAEHGVRWGSGRGVHKQSIRAPEQGGLFYFHAKGRSGAFFSFPLVVAPRRPQARLAVIAATNTWNAYNPFGGRSNYCLPGGLMPTPIVNAQNDMARYREADYGEWNSADEFPPLSFDRPEPDNSIPESDECTDPIEGRQACHLSPAEWRMLGWLEREGFAYDLYSDRQLDDGTLPLEAYRAVLLGPHPEYWSLEAYRKVKRWVFSGGGRLLYLGGNGLNCAVEYLDGGTAMRCWNRWPTDRESRLHHQLESEANLLGVVYSDLGAMTAAPYRVVEPDHWAFAGTGLKKGDPFGEESLQQRYGGGASGIETDKLSPSSPTNTVLLAKGCNPDDGGAHMVHFETPGGGAVFSAGSISYPSALLCDRVVSALTANVLRRFLS